MKRTQSKAVKPARKLRKRVGIGDRDSCPICKSSWVGATIPPASRHLYSGDKPHFSRLIGCETPEYDGVSYWQCPDCGGEWDRWTGVRRNPRAEAFLRTLNLWTPTK